MSGPVGWCFQSHKYGWPKLSGEAAPRHTRRPRKECHQTLCRVALHVDDVQRTNPPLRTDAVEHDAHRISKAANISRRNRRRRALPVDRGRQDQPQPVCRLAPQQWDDADAQVARKHVSDTASARSCPRPVCLESCHGVCRQRLRGVYPCIRTCRKHGGRAHHTRGREAGPACWHATVPADLAHDRASHGSVVSFQATANPVFRVAVVDANFQRIVSSQLQTQTGAVCPAHAVDGNHDHRVRRRGDEIQVRGSSVV